MTKKKLEQEFGKWHIELSLEQNIVLGYWKYRERSR